MAVRYALGASRQRIVRLLLVENALLGVVGSTVGLLLAWWLVDAVAALGSASLPRLDAISLDGRVLVYAAVLALGTVLAFGLIPALRMARAGGSGSLGGDSSLRAGWRGMTVGRTRAGVVVAELAVAVVLLVGAGLMLATLSTLNDDDLGMRIEGTLIVPLSFRGTEHVAPQAQPALLNAIESSVSSLPEIESVALVNHAPIAGDLWRTSFAVVGQPAPVAAEQKPKAAMRVVSDRYFHAAGIRFEAGRQFGSRDRADTRPVIVINRTLADRFFPDADAVGNRLLLGADTAEASAVAIIGVIADTRQDQIQSPVLPEIYFPYAQNPSPWLHATTILIHTAGDVAQVALAVRARLQATFPQMAVGNPKTMNEVVHGSLATVRFQTVSLAAFALLALLLAGLGVYGLISFLAGQRSNEIGLRIVLGARQAQIISLVLGDALRWVSLGLAIGLVAALALARVASHLVYGVSVYDRSILGLAAGVLGVVALLAAVVPAWRASRANPMDSLRAS